jgi:hypothetical protein
MSASKLPRLTSAGGSGINILLNRCENMQSPLSQNEWLILDRQMTMVAHQLAEIAALLESREGATPDISVAARALEERLADLARKIHNRTVQQDAGGWASRAKTA